MFVLVRHRLVRRGTFTLLILSNLLYAQRGAIFNYINLGSALAGRRAKEMGMRTVLGASKGQIVWYYLKESLVFTAVCTVFAVLLAYVFRPIFTHYVDTTGSASPVSVPFAWHWSFGMVAGVIGLALLIGLVAGWIPSRIASRFDAIRVLKGDYRMASKRILSRTFDCARAGHGTAVQPYGP